MQCINATNGNSSHCARAHLRCKRLHVTLQSHVTCFWPSTGTVQRLGKRVPHVMPERDVRMRIGQLIVVQSS